MISYRQSIYLGYMVLFLIVMVGFFIIKTTQNDITEACNLLGLNTSSCCFVSVGSKELAQELKATPCTPSGYTNVSCYVNDIRIPCPLFPTQDKAHFFNGTDYVMNGVCPGVKPFDNRTVEDCINEVSHG